MDDELRDLVYSIYGKVLQTTNEILSNCKTFDISILQMEDPSYEEIADQLTETAGILWAISDEFPDDPEGFHVAAKSVEYIQDVKGIAKAIRQGDEERLNELVAKLDRRPFL